MCHFDFDTWSDATAIAAWTQEVMGSGGDIQLGLGKGRQESISTHTIINIREKMIICTMYKYCPACSSCAK